MSKKKVELPPGIEDLDFVEAVFARIKQRSHLGLKALGKELAVVWLCSKKRRSLNDIALILEMNGVEATKQQVQAAIMAGCREVALPHLQSLQDEWEADAQRKAQKRSAESE